MKVRIHHGAHEIGGNCVEVEHRGERLVLDVGRPLTADRHAHVPLPEIDGLAEGTADGSVVGVLISHHHADHWGLADQIKAGLPIYMGAATQRILKTASFWTWGLDVTVAGHLENRVSFDVGPFTVTPYLNDHSAFDAYSLLVEADGESLFYTGDIRGHGRKAGVFQQLLDNPPIDVDVLLMEGTNLQPGLPPKPVVTESQVESDMVDTFTATDGLAMVVTSAQNIDRLVTIYRAAKRAERDLIVDPYTADIARATGYDTIPRPHPDWPRIHTYMPRWQSVRVKQSEEFDRLKDINPYRLFPEDIAEDPSRYVMLFSGGRDPKLAESGALNGATCIWSLWSGYLDETSGQRLQTFLDQHDIPLVQHHTSGHASLEDLQRLAAAIDPTRIVPIHTFGADTFHDHFDRVDQQPDGVWWELGSASTDVVEPAVTGQFTLSRVDVARLLRTYGLQAEQSIGRALGDDAPWTIAIPQLHRILDDPQGGHWYPRPPRRGDDHVAGAGYYAPLVHGMLYRLGWVRPERGMLDVIWGDRRGEDPFLDFVIDVASNEIDLEVFLAWWYGAWDHELFNDIWPMIGFEDDDSPANRIQGWLDEQVAWASEQHDLPLPVGLGFDELHLGHVRCAVEEPDTEATFAVVDEGTHHAMLIVDSLRGWYRALHTHPELQFYERASGASWSVEVITRTTGSLGVYRRSPDTGIRHATTEEIHLSGVWS